VLLDQPTDGAELQAEHRRSLLSVATRKLAAAKTLAAGGLGAEAIGQAHACMIAVLRALAADVAEPEELPSARLLYEKLVPQGTVTLEQAALVSRADGLARAYADSTHPVSGEIVAAVIEDGKRLLEHAGGAHPNEGWQ
jgi:hypothetical protein